MDRARGGRRQPRRARASISCRCASAGSRTRRSLALAEGVRQAIAGTGARMLVNDRVDVALAAGADGVHLPGSAVTCARLRAIVPADDEFLVGRSVHSVAEAIAAADDGGCDYLVFGTVFESESKPAGHAVAGLGGAGRGVCRRRACRCWPSAASPPARVPDVVRAGAAGVAAIGLFTAGGERELRDTVGADPAGVRRRANRSSQIAWIQAIVRRSSSCFSRARPRGTSACWRPAACCRGQRTSRSRCSSSCPTTRMPEIAAQANATIARLPPCGADRLSWRPTSPTNCAPSLPPEVRRPRLPEVRSPRLPRRASARAKRRRAARRDDAGRDADGAVPDDPQARVASLPIAERLKLATKGTREQRGAAHSRFQPHRGHGGADEPEADRVGSRSVREDGERVRGRAADYRDQSRAGSRTTASSTP